MGRDLSKGELVGIVRRLMAAEGTEQELDRMLRVLRANVPNPAVSDLMSWPPADTDLTAEELVDRALAPEPSEP